jgi:hypothetical protein
VLLSEGTVIVNVTNDTYRSITFDMCSRRTSSLEQNVISSWIALVQSHNFLILEATQLTRHLESLIEQFRW